MPRPLFHATMPGPAANGGPFALVVRVLLLGMALVFAFFLVIIAFVIGAFLLALRVLGLGGKTRRTSPFAPFGATFVSFQSRPTATTDDADAVVVQELEGDENQQDTAKQLEEFHGSLDEFLEQRKDQNRS